MTGTELQTWLKQEGRTRAWLAAALGVSLRTVEGWLTRSESARPISAAREAQIMALMTTPRPGREVGTVSVTVPFDDDEWARIVASYPPGTDVKAEVERQMLALIRASRLPDGD